MHKHGGKVDDIKFKTVYSGPGSDMTFDEAKEYGKSIGLNKAYFACDNDTGRYNGDTVVLYNDKNDLPFSFMREDAERAETISQMTRDVMNIDVKPANDSNKNVIISVPKHNAGQYTDRSHVAVSLANNDGVERRGYIAAHDLKQVDEDYYQLDLGKPSDKHVVKFSDMAGTEIEMTANEIGQLHDNALEQSRRRHELWAKNDAERRKANEKKADSRRTDLLLNVTVDHSNDAFLSLSEDDIPF